MKIHIFLIALFLTTACGKKSNRTDLNSEARSTDLVQCTVSYHFTDKTFKEDALKTEKRNFNYNNDPISLNVEDSISSFNIRFRPAKRDLSQGVENSNKAADFEITYKSKVTQDQVTMSTRKVGMGHNFLTVNIQEHDYEGKKVNSIVVACGYFNG
jgi:major membrane immunogen (membrane-anchored lipoprotein)